MEFEFQKFWSENVIFMVEQFEDNVIRITHLSKYSFPSFKLWIIEISLYISISRILDMLFL